MPAPSTAYRCFHVDHFLPVKEQNALFDRAFRGIKETLTNVGETIIKEGNEESDLEDYCWTIETTSGIFIKVEGSLELYFPVKTMWTAYLLKKLEELGFEEDDYEDDSRFIS